MWLSEITLQLVFFRILALLIMTGVQGFILAGTALLLGDRGPRFDGRLTVSPTHHMDLVGTVCAVFFGIGWGKPMRVDGKELRTGPIGIVLVIVAGFLGLLVLAALMSALILPALTSLPHAAGLATAAFLRSAGSMTIWFALFGLLPIPPLAGGLLPKAFGVRISREVQWILIAALVLALATGAVRAILDPIHAALAEVILGG